MLFHSRWSFYLKCSSRRTPGRRFQTPAELLKAITAITGANDARRRIARKGLLKTFASSPIGPRKPPAVLAIYERNPAEVYRFASDLIELSSRYDFLHFLAVGTIFRGWARCASGDTAEGIRWIEQGIRDYRAAGSVLGLAFHLARKAEALHLADRTSEALEAINEAEALAERLERRSVFSELHWLRGVFLGAMGADETQIETSIGEAIRIAKQQKSVSLEKRAEATYAEYRRQKASGSGGRGFRLPLW
jgi:hypothetical protein